MKNRKWLTYTIGILLALIALAAAGGIGFRIGVTQSEAFVKAMKDMPRPPFGENFQGMRPDHGFGPEGNKWHRGMPFFSPIFELISGLIHLLVLGILIWAVYKIFQNSGWRLVRVETSTTSSTAALESETPKANNKKKKRTE